MRLPLKRLRAILVEVPAHGKLAYSLLRDPGVPVAPKVALLAVLGIVVSPINLPAWVPLVGELDVLALGVLAVKVFVDACPEDLVREHREALKRGVSLFDRDAGRAGAALRLGVLRLMEANRLPRALPPLSGGAPGMAFQEEENVTEYPRYRRHRGTEEHTEE
jgi:uncharacterized membrane protein YkvA (DUF1232 family)